MRRGGHGPKRQEAEFRRWPCRAISGAPVEPRPPRLAAGSPRVCRGCAVEELPTGHRIPVPCASTQQLALGPGASRTAAKEGEVCALLVRLAGARASGGSSRLHTLDTVPGLELALLVGRILRKARRPAACLKRIRLLARLIVSGGHARHGGEGWVPVHPGAFPAVTRGGPLAAPSVIRGLSDIKLIDAPRFALVLAHVVTPKHHLCIEGLGPGEVRAVPAHAGGGYTQLL
mmetsp:Transcript_4021/g.11398  ORF Transcript_4021/g.11398 Transcript_4021/m.11398 type:complete len:231 (+) Transcript_4021:75-767(+)